MAGYIFTLKVNSFIVTFLFFIKNEEKASLWDNLLDSIKEHNDISFEILERNQILNSDILYEEVDISFENC